MRILKREPDMFRLRIDCEDDLWVIARICVKKRSLGMLGERRDQTTAGEEGGREDGACLDPAPMLAGDLRAAPGFAVRESRRPGGVVGPGQSLCGEGVQWHGGHPPTVRRAPRGRPTGRRRVEV